MTINKFSKSDIQVEYIKFNKDTKLLSICICIILIIISLLISSFLENGGNIILIILYFLFILLLFILLHNLPKYFLPFLYDKIFKYKAVNIKNHDFFTSEYDYYKKLQNDKNSTNIVFIVTPVTKLKKAYNENLTQKYKALKQEFIYLAFFWYAYEKEKVKLRSTLPLYAFILSFIFFLANLYILNFLSSNFFKISLAVSFLIILYFLMLKHINNLLDPNYYIQSIKHLFKESNINFKSKNTYQQIFTYLDKTFLINIYDIKSNSFICLNQSPEFEKFIINAYLDKEGRDTIINIFISVFIMIYITIFTQVLIDNEMDKVLKGTNNTTINIKVGK